jgi:hypothetical protein
MAMSGPQFHNGIPFQPSTPKRVWRKVRKTLIIDSRDRQFTAESHPGHYVVTLPAVYQNIYSVTLKSIEMPFSFYNFTACAKNVTLTFTDPVEGEKTCIIPDGNYTSTQLASAVQTAMNGVLPSNLYTVTYSNITNDIKITRSGTSSFTLYTGNPNPTVANCGKAVTAQYNTWYSLPYFLGFEQSDTPLSSVSDGTNTSLVGAFSVNPAPSTYVLMELVNLNKIDETAIDNKKSGRVDGSFAKIPITVNTGDFVFLTDTGTNPLNQSVYTPPISKLSQLHVKFRHHDGRIINFNGVEHSFTLQLELLDNVMDEYSSLELSKL